MPLYYSYSNSPTTYGATPSSAGLGAGVDVSGATPFGEADWAAIIAMAEEMTHVRFAATGWYKAEVNYLKVAGDASAGTAATLDCPWIIFGPEYVSGVVTYRPVYLICGYDNSGPPFTAYACSGDEDTLDAYFANTVSVEQDFVGTPIDAGEYKAEGTFYDVTLDAFGSDWSTITGAAESYRGYGIASVDYFTYDPVNTIQFHIPYIVYGPEEDVNGSAHRRVWAFGTSAVGAPEFLFTMADIATIRTWIDGQLDTPDSGAVDGSFSGWTAYHDALVEELKGLIDHYGWQDDAAVVTRVEEIQDELREVGQTLFDAPLNNMLSEFETARLNAEDANDSRYAQLIGDVSGEVDPEKLMSYTQLAKHMLEEHYDAIQDDMVNVQGAQELLDDDIVTELETMWTTLDAHFTTIFSLIERGGWNETKAKFWEMKLSMYQSATMAKIEAMRAKAGNVMALELARVQWRQAVADRMAQLYQLAPAVVERRTDIGPSLADIANLTMNIGRGQGAQELLDSFSPTTFIAPAGSSSSGLGKLLTDATKKT